MRPEAIVLALLLILLGQANAEARCAEISASLFGFHIGPFGSYPESLRAGIVREGAAELVKGVGFESLEGSSGQLRYDRIMVFFDRGEFVGFTAVAEPIAGTGLLIADVARAVEAELGAPLRESPDGSWQADCPEGDELLLSPTVWAGKPRAKLQFQRRPAMEGMRAYIKEYCSDPKRRRPEDACN